MRRLRNFTKTIATALLATSQKNRDSLAVAGKPGFASAITTMTAGMTCTAASGDTISCFITMATEHSQTSLGKRDSRTNKFDGERVALFSTTIVIVISTFSFAITSSLTRR